MARLRRRSHNASNLPHRLDTRSATRQRTGNGYAVVVVESSDTPFLTCAVPLAAIRAGRAGNNPGWEKQKAPDFHPGLFCFEAGASGGIRTHDPCLRRAVLYPAELRMRCGGQSYACLLRSSMALRRAFGRGWSEVAMACRAIRLIYQALVFLNMVLPRLATHH